MKKTAKALLLVLCALILVVGSVFGTLAYLTSQDEVTNTFTVGNVKITMDEAKVDVYGVKVDDTTRTDNNAYLIVPGHEYVKDPTIYVGADSEDCYVYVEINNQIADIEDSANTVAAQMTTLGWTPIATGSNVYYYNLNNEPVIDKENGPKTLVVFNNFKITGDLIQEPADPADRDPDALYIEDYAPEKDGEGNITAQKMITVNAYAVQADGFDSAVDAWNATFGAPVAP